MSDDKMAVSISVENPTAETERGIIIAALYDTDGNCIQVKFVQSDTAEFKKTAIGYIKAFLWKSLVGENQMTPIILSERKSIE